MLKGGRVADGEEPSRVRRGAFEARIGIDRGGGGKVRGGRRMVAPDVDVSASWKLESFRKRGVMMECDFSHNLVKQRARLF